MCEREVEERLTLSLEEVGTSDSESGVSERPSVMNALRKFLM